MLIDGSSMEGGGQVLRCALSFSCLLNQPIRVINIRAARKSAGLRPQHLTAVNALSYLFNARVEGNELGSRELFFSPRQERDGNYSFDVGTAGSITLILHTLLPPLAFSKAQKRVELVGGTHVALAPPFQYFSEVFLPIAQRMGFKATAKLKRYGFYPAGGGIAEMTVDAVSELKPINLLSRGKLKELKILSVVSNLPPTLAKKQAIALKKKLAEKGYVARIQESKIEAEGNASFLFLQAKYANSVAGFSALGEVGKTAEQVAGEVANAFFAFEESDACVDEYLGDQLILPMALAKRRSSMRVLITRHLLTNIFVAEKFLSVLFKVRGREGEIGEVTVNGAGFTR